ncbi:MBL fold metallo-hydrolase [Sorangium cellulosum]|uniref:MBL fold metallo-hydrolase n=1 Tax=Sorangium cellulosum TaxID=56 RepID=A0A4P2Q2P0_SORCE|nr:MBL fold metallo-hydrolase [Sorangium cellulosum]AUX23544.1 MBL fold metallo-hydrolase [Sorangium cellulosum]
MKITIIASGSGGNATLFASRGTRVLVDAGVGPRVLEQCLAAAGGEPGWAPDAIVITHAHADHVGAAARYNKKLKIPIYASEATARAAALGDPARVRVFSPREPFEIGALTVSPRPLPHDAAQVALVVGDGARRAALVTDLGEVPPGLLEHVAGCDVLLLESNHDADMLAGGPYPQHLKRRISSSRGHLSNAQACALLAALPGGTHTVALMHLSEINNRPELALEAARDALSGRRTRLLAAPPRGPLVLDAAPPAGLPPGLARASAGALAPARQLDLFRGM